MRLRHYGAHWGSLLALLVLFLTTGVINATPASAAAPATTPGAQAPSAPTLGAQATTGRFFFVSKRGNNRDGRSWASAWNELDRINWTVVQPGDTIVIDGGATEMRYTTTLTIRKSGITGRPIVIRPSIAPGYNGKVVIFGGRATPLPYCGQSSYSYQTSGVRQVGIQVGAAAHVVIDGTKWRGISVYGHNGTGVQFANAAHTVKLRYLDIYDNGGAIRTDGKWQPVRFGPSEGIDLHGTNITVERTISRDNGSDAIRSNGGIKNFTLRQSWLAVTRKAPNGDNFNRCTHQDGIQVYKGGAQSGMLIEDSVIGPGFLQGVWLAGETVWSNVTIRHTLLYKSDNTNIGDKGNPSKNWTLQNVTSVRQAGAANHNISMAGSGHTIQNSIFVGGRNMSLATKPTAAGNCQYQVPGGLTIGTVVDPKFGNSAADSYALQAGSPCAGKGSRITSVQQLLNLR